MAQAGHNHPASQICLGHTPTPSEVCSSYVSQAEQNPLAGKFYASDLRVRQIGKNSGGYDDMYLCGIEIYGKLRELLPEEIAVRQARF